MSDLMRDIDDAMRAEKMTKFWNEHKSAILTGVIALVLGTSAHTAWNAWDKQQKRENTSALIAALDAKDKQPALEQLAAEQKGDTRVIARMTAAGQALSAKDYAGALKLYKDVAADKKADPIFRDLAILQSVNLSLDQDQAADAKSLLAQIEPVAASTKSPWQGQALLTRALIKAHKGKDLKAAIADLELVAASETLPRSLRDRAQALRNTYLQESQS